MNLKSTYTTKLLCFLLIVWRSSAFFYGFRSLWLDDWDSVLFTRALDELDILKHQPHPPGYVAYVYTARIFYLFLGEPEISLIVCSVLSGALTLGLVYLLGTILVNSVTGWLWSAHLFCIPAFTLSSTVAMADVVVLPFYLGSVICFVQGTRKKRRWLVEEPLALAVFWRPPHGVGSWSAASVDLPLRYHGPIFLL